MATGRYEGGCQCGAVRYDVEADLDSTFTCNCSRCSKLGWLVTFAPAAKLALRQGEDRLTEYRFNRMQVRHLFGATCGIETFARGLSPRDGRETVAINVRCIDGVDPATLHPTQVDGRSF